MVEPWDLDLYDSVGKKVGHFSLGFIGFYVVLAVLIGVINYIAMQSESGEGFFLLPIAVLILLVASLVHYFRAGKRYIAIGILCAFLIPVNAGGACALMLINIMGPQ